MPSKWDHCPQLKGLPRGLQQSSPLGWGLLSLLGFVAGNCVFTFTNLFPISLFSFLRKGEGPSQ